MSDDDHIANPDTPLGSLYSRLANWIPIVEFEQAMHDYFVGPRSEKEVADYRAKRGALKRLRDEVGPVLHHVKFVKAEGEIRFQFSNAVPDCWLRDSPASNPHGLEVTVAQAREQYHLGVELNEKGVGRGFLGLSDDAPSHAFSDKLAKQRVAYTSDSALRVIGSGIKRCLKTKTHPKYTGFDLLIEAPLLSLPNKRWGQIHEELRLAALATPFRQIHVIGNQHAAPFGFRIK